MIAFKACPHCHGDLYGGADREVSCLQCGYEPRRDDRSISLDAMRQWRASEAAGAIAPVEVGHGHQPRNS
jgi:hypothetical protein